MTAEQKLKIAWNNDHTIDLAREAIAHARKLYGLAADFYEEYHDGDTCELLEEAKEFLDGKPEGK